MTRNMREPSTPLLGWLASTLMQNGNQKVAVSAVHHLQVLDTYIVCEVGAGNGLSLHEIVKYTSKDIYTIEISKVSRRQLRSLNLHKNVSILGI